MLNFPYEIFELLISHIGDFLDFFWHRERVFFLADSVIVFLEFASELRFIVLADLVVVFVNEVFDAYFHAFCQLNSPLELGLQVD